MDENLLLNALDPASAIRVTANVLDWEEHVPAWVSPWPNLIM